MQKQLEGIFDVENRDIIPSKAIEDVLSFCDERTLNLIHELIEKECKRRLPDSYVGTNCRYIHFKSVLDEKTHKNYFQGEDVIVPIKAKEMFEEEFVSPLEEED